MKTQMGIGRSVRPNQSLNTAMENGGHTLDTASGIQILSSIVQVSSPCPSSLARPAPDHVRPFSPDPVHGNPLCPELATRPPCVQSLSLRFFAHTFSPDPVQLYPPGPTSGHRSPEMEFWRGLLLACGDFGHLGVRAWSLLSVAEATFAEHLSVFLGAAWLMVRGRHVPPSLCVCPGRRAISTWS